MDLYTRRQLTLLLGVVLAAGGGLAVDGWRRTHPALADRLEAFDRAPAPAPRAASPELERPPRAAAPAPPTGRRDPVDLNDATAEELQRLPGIGPGLAARIVDARRQRGAFTSVEDLRSVRGIGVATLARVRPLLAVASRP